MTATETSTPAGLRLLVVDDEQPAREELAWLLGQDARVLDVVACGSGAEALRLLAPDPLGGRRFDGILLDVQMPGLSGLDLAGVLARFREPTPVVFVTAHTEHAVEAFDLHAVDYLLKPVRAERLAEAVRRLLDAVAPSAPTGPPAAGTRDAGAAPDARDEVIAVERSGVTRFVARSQVRFVEAQGDYARLHTGEDSHLVRLPISSLEERWGGAGFVRVHRSLLVALAHVDQVRTDAGRVTLTIGDRELPVSRRLAPALREELRRTRQPHPAASPAATPEDPA